jgi:hypothetical protein
MAGNQQPDPSEREQELRRTVAAGEPVDLRSGDSELDDPAGGAEWGPERTVRAEHVYELLVGDAELSRAVVVRGARISGGLNLEATTIACPFVLDGCFCDRPINLQEARAETIRITGCQLLCVAADQLETRGNLVLSHSAAAVISLHGARLGGNLILNSTTLTGGSWPINLADASLIPRRYAAADREDNMALVAGGLRVDGDMFCRHGFSAHGQVWLVGANVSRQVIFDGARLENNDGVALFADRLNVGQNMFCRNVETRGGVQLGAAHVGGQLVFDGARLSNEHGEEAALSLVEANVLGSLWLRFDEPPKGAVRLDGAEVGAVYDDEKTWPSELSLRDFTYGYLESSKPVPVKRRLRWLTRDPKGYAPQPYEQLVAYYRRAGDEQGARRVAIAKQRRRRGELAAPSKAWSLFLDASVGYGYRAWLAGVWLFGLVALGWIAFDHTYPEHFRAADGPAATPDFQPLVYSLDLVLPVVNLGQSDAWIAEGPAQWGALLTVAGWVLASVLLAVLTGLLKRD